MNQFVYQEFPKKRRFGIELEVSNNLSKQQLGEVIRDYEIIYKNPSYSRKRSVRVTSGEQGWAQTQNNTYWHVKFDRTCGPNGKNYDHGWEVASYIGSGIDDANHISRAARFLNNAGAETNLNCGFHIHVEVDDFTPYQMGILLGRWLKIESFLISICHPSRYLNEYCMPLSNLFQTRKSIYDIGERKLKFDPSFLWEIMRPHDLGIHNNHSKRVTLNTVGFANAQNNSFYPRNTVELRLPECLLDENHVRNWLILIVNFVEVCKNKNDTLRNLKSSNSVDEALIHLGFSGEESFLFLSKELLNAKLWFLDKIMKTTQNQTIFQQAKRHFELATLI